MPRGRAQRSTDLVAATLPSRPGTKQRAMEELVLTEIRRRQAADAAAERAGVLERELPTSIRFLFYEFEQAGHISKATIARTDGKKGRRPDQDLGEAVTRLRAAGLIPWNYIADESRIFHYYGVSSDTIEEAALNQLRYLRINPWRGALRPVILCEARTVGGVLGNLCATYAVDLAPTNGQARGFLITTVVPRLRGDTQVLYIGDLDAAGDDIEQNTRRVLEDATGRTFDGETWHRIALTPAQVAGLQRRGVQPIRKTDRRYRDGNPHLAWECEALGQVDIQRMVRRALDRMLPEPLRAVQEQEAAERAALVTRWQRRR